MANDQTVDVEVLKSEMRGLGRSMSELSTKMDAIIGIQIQMVSLQKDVDHHRELTARSTEAMADVRKRVSEVESSLLSTKSVVRGALAVGVLLFGFAQWYFIGQLANLEQIAKDSRSLERRTALLEHNMTGTPSNKGQNEIR